MVLVTTLDVLFTGPLTRWDRSSMLLPGTLEVDPGFWHVFWRTIVWAGQFWLVGGLAGIAGCLAAWRIRRWWPALVTGVWIVVINIILLAIKKWLQRPAPHAGYDALWVPGKLSYPSGHAAMSASCLVMVVVLVTLGRSDSLRRKALWWAYGISAAASVATVVLGYHWPTDTITGYALGLLFGWGGQSAITWSAGRFGMGALESGSGDPGINLRAQPL
ncbi:phosphatase PAP2 family protein [Actinocorallia longicatena]|uniref:phosphatase PAP2 family protein n=1 Tax=Actinocorallia longicatena TaxID=111803 RepID=UPI0031DB5007